MDGVEGCIQGAVPVCAVQELILNGYKNLSEAVRTYLNATSPSDPAIVNYTAKGGVSIPATHSFRLLSEYPLPGRVRVHNVEHRCFTKMLCEQHL